MSATATSRIATHVRLPGLHRSQREVADRPARFKVLAAGRRFGKTRLGCVLCIKMALVGGRAWWVAPSYPIANIGWRGIKQLARQIPGCKVRESHRLVDFPTGGCVQVKSADNPDSLRGEGLDLAVLDECAFMLEEAWLEALRPALSDRQGGALFISTPKGRNWFWRLWQGANGNGSATEGTENTENKGWAAWQLPTSDNPFIESEEIEAARGALPERVFLQEYLAEFVEDAGGVFRRVTEAATAHTQDGPVAGHEHVIGVDWGKMNDFTVLTVLDVTDKALVHLDRFNRIDYALQMGRLRALVERFKPRRIIPELNSMGQPLVEQLQRDGLRVAPFTTTNASKADAIDALALAFERGDIKIIPDPILIGELQAYEAERLPGGLLRYGAPAGMHDDCVMSLALAWTAARSPVSRDYVVG